MNPENLPLCAKCGKNKAFIFFHTKVVCGECCQKLLAEEQKRDESWFDEVEI